MQFEREGEDRLVWRKKSSSQKLKKRVGQVLFLLFARVGDARWILILSMSPALARKEG